MNGLRTERMVALLVVVICALTIAPQPCRAWGDEGHEIIGLIAAHYLTPAVAQKVDSLLAGDDSHLTPTTDLQHEATWADKFRDSDRNSPNPVHYNQTHDWHFVDIEIQGGNIDTACFDHPVVPPGTVASMGPAQDCVVDKINEFMAELASTSTDANEKRLALQFLLHFIGDLHQPLHASDDHDKGGNTKKVKASGISTNNLHHYWDTEFVLKLGSDPTLVAQNLTAKITPSQKAKWSGGTPSDWALESTTLAKSKVYGLLPSPDTTGKYLLSATYVSTASKIVTSQLSRAGVRLAKVLNDALK